jgi:hypothetical protein
MQRWAFTQQPFGLPTVALPLKSETLNQVFIGTFNGDRLAYFNRPSSKQTATEQVPIEELIEQPVDSLPIAESGTDK